MKKHTIYGLALAGALVAAIPFLAYAQDNEDVEQVPPPPQVGNMMGQPVPNAEHGQSVRGMHPQNAENNRDFRNVVLRHAQNGTTTSTSTRPIMFRAEHENADGQNDRDGDHPMLPSWITASSSPFHGQRLSSTTILQLMHAAREGSTTELRGHEKLKSAPLANFAQLQSNLISQLTQSLDRLKDARTKISDRIQSAQQSGRDMTEAANLLTAADSKITAAEQAIGSLSSLSPTVTVQGTVTASTTVSLEHPREIGKSAIQAVNDARKALNDVVVAIAHAMGLETDRDGRILPPPPAATSTPATTTQQ